MSYVSSIDSWKQMETIDGWSDIYHEGYVHPFQPEATHIIQYWQQAPSLKIPMEYFSDQDNPNQHKNSHKLCNEKGHSLLSLKKVNGNRDYNIVISQ